MENGTHVLWVERSNEDRVAQGFSVTRKVISVTGASIALIPGRQVAAGVAAGLTSIISIAADQSYREFGCHKGYCWAYFSIGSQWCYTTRSYSQS